MSMLYHTQLSSPAVARLCRVALSWNVVPSTVTLATLSAYIAPPLHPAPMAAPQHQTLWRVCVPHCTAATAISDFRLSCNSIRNPSGTPFLACQCRFWHTLGDPFLLHNCCIDICHAYLQHCR